MLVYTPILFKSKRNHNISHAPPNIFETISKCQTLGSQVRDNVIPVIKRKAYDAHHKLILTK